MVELGLSQNSINAALGTIFHSFPEIPEREHILMIYELTSWALSFILQDVSDWLSLMCLDAWKAFSLFLLCSGLSQFELLSHMPSRSFYVILQLHPLTVNVTYSTVCALLPWWLESLGVMHFNYHQLPEDIIISLCVWLLVLVSMNSTYIYFFAMSLICVLNVCLKFLIIYSRYHWRRYKLGSAVLHVQA